MTIMQFKNNTKKPVALFTLLLFVVSLCSSSYAAVDALAGQAAASVVPVEDVSVQMPKTGNVTVNFKDVDIKTVLHYLSEVSGVDIIPAPGVDGNVTMRLRDKPWEVALDIVTRNYGYAYSSDDDQGIIRVMPRGQLHAESPVTEVITLNNLVREIELSKSGETSTSDEVVVEQKQESINQLMAAINSMLDENKGEKATFVPSVNAIIVTSIPARISQIKAMIAKIDKRTAQIILDTKVIEITLTDDERFGIDWNTVISAAGARRPITFPFSSVGADDLSSALRGFLPHTGTDGASFPQFDMSGNQLDPDGFLTTGNSANLFSFGTLDFSTFTATLRLLDNRGDTEILSAPRITTLDNQKATIKVVDKIMLQKTQEASQTANVITVEFEKEEDAREVGIKLTVIPHVNEDGDISVNLLPEVSSPATGTTNGFQAIEAVGGTQTVALTFSSREANTIVRAKDGETIFLGGLIKKNVILTDNKVPILGDLLGGIPVLGNAFKYEAENVQRTEIVFFVTLHIVQDAQDSIKDSETEEFYRRYFLEGEGKSNVAKDYKGTPSRNKERKEEFKDLEEFDDVISSKDSGPLSGDETIQMSENVEVNKQRIAQKRLNKQTVETQQSPTSSGTNVVRKGILTTKKEQEKIYLAVPQDAEDKKKKPWFDFREK